MSAGDVRFGSVGEELLALERARARLDAEVARRLREFDRSCEWAAHGSRSAAAFLVTKTRCARGEAYRRVRVAREVEALERDCSRVGGGRGHDPACGDDHQGQAGGACRCRVRRVRTRTVGGGAGRVTPKTWRARSGSGATPSTRTSTATAPTPRPSRTGNGTGGRSTTPNRSTGSVSGPSPSSPKAPTSSTGRCNAPTTTHRADDPRTPAQQRADALVEIARIYLAGKPSRANLPHVLVLTDAATLRGDHVGECRLADGTRISPDTARRIACDANIQELVLDETGVPLWLGRSTRTFTPDQYRAMVARDGGCRCCGASPEHCDAHHVNEWNNQGPTDIDNGMLLCRYGCHRGMHEGHWNVAGNPNGRLEFTDRDGNHIATSQPQPRVATHPHQTRPPTHPPRTTHPHPPRRSSDSPHRRHIGGHASWRRDMLTRWAS